MQGQWQSQTRRLNRHYQSGGGAVAPVIATGVWKVASSGTGFQYNDPIVAYVPLPAQWTLVTPSRYAKWARGNVKPVVYLDTLRSGNCVVAAVDLRAGFRRYDGTNVVNVVYRWVNSAGQVVRSGFDILTAITAPNNSVSILTENTPVTSPSIFGGDVNYGVNLLAGGNDILPATPGIALDSVPTDCWPDRVYISWTLYVCMNVRFLGGADPATGRVEFVRI